MSNATNTQNRRVLRAVSANLRRLLSDKHWSQADLARESGESEMSVSRILRGSHMPGVGPISRIAKALGVTLDSLLVGPPKQSRI